MSFQGKEHIRTKIVMNGKIIEQVRDFNYLGCNMSYCERKEVNNKINKYQRMCGTISKTLERKAQLSTQIKFYKAMAVPVDRETRKEYEIDVANRFSALEVL